MIQAKPRFSTFEEYLSYDDGTDKRYELLNGELIELPRCVTGRYNTSCEVYLCLQVTSGQNGI